MFLTISPLVLAGRQPLVCSDYCFLSCSFYVVIKKKTSIRGAFYLKNLKDSGSSIQGGVYSKHYGNQFKENMIEENISKNLRWKNINETRNYFIEVVNQQDITSDKHKVFKLYTSTLLNYIEHLLILTSVVTGRVSVSSFAPLVGIPIIFASSAVKLKNK